MAIRIENQYEGALPKGSLQQIEQALDSLSREHTRGIERVRDRAQAFTEKARQIINEFPESPYQRALLAVTDLVTERDH